MLIARERVKQLKCTYFGSLCCLNVFWGTNARLEPGGLAENKTIICLMTFSHYPDQRARKGNILYEELIEIYFPEWEKKCYLLVNMKWEGGGKCNNMILFTIHGKMIQQE